VRDVGGFLGALDAAVQRAQERAPAGRRITREGWVRALVLREATRLAGAGRARR
jgi:hypothetical protein